MLPDAPMLWGASATGDGLGADTGDGWWRTGEGEAVLGTAAGVEVDAGARVGEDGTEVESPTEELTNCPPENSKKRCGQDTWSSFGLYRFGIPTSNKCVTLSPST
jgi:hypothetical protein